MTKYIYKARDQNGNLVKGQMDADSQKEVVRALNEENLIAVYIGKEEKKKKKKSSKKKKKSLFSAAVKVKDREVAVFCRQFSTMVAAGVSVAEALSELSQSVENPGFRKILIKITDDIRAGSRLSEAFAMHSSVFSAVFVHMISAGEESGSLPSVLRDLSVYLEKKVKLKSQLRSATMYPMFVGGFFLVILLALVLFLIPRFKGLFETFGAEMPLPTQMVMNFSDMMVRNIPIFIFMIIVFIFAFIMIYRTKPGKLVIDSYKLKLPIFGPLIQKMTLARFFQTLATLLKSGVDVVSCLEIAAKVTYNAEIERKVDKIRKGIVEGSSLSDELRRSGMFPRLTISMASVGEKSGAIDEMFVKITDYYTEEVDADVEGFSSLIEPVMIISLGFIVGIFVVTMYLPIFQIAGTVMRGG